MTRSQGQTLAVLKYDGGGDWYSNPTALKNLIQFSNTHGATKLKLKPEVVHPEDPALFSYPFIHMTGHGNVVFSDEALKNLNTYLIGGGFLHIDDNYGMKPYILPQLKKLFPSKVLKEVPSDHPIFNLIFEFPDGLPKIHEHDGLAPQALGIFHENRLILLCTFESDLSDGWEDQSVHKDPEDIRLKALQMGANIIKYAFEF
ncbi:conserved hypothetical protein (DUF4159) [Formosa sp. Hel3_A1_48]|jgi:hypothetical protein|nr:conserved hypothetical protein (DUF4159) [Formosa sp. Hel3_A1_48]MDA9761274.1 DUF4159 domain-containing protein [Flavobacteriaceae bacterium]